jgi:phage terminase small subunit
MPAKKQLSPRQLKFIDLIISGLSATDAAKGAGYAAHTATMQGSRLLTIANIAAEISRRRKRLETKSDITAQRVLEELGRIGFSDLRKYLKVTGKSVQVFGSDKWCDADAAAISEIKIVSKEDEDGEVEQTVQLRMHDKIESLKAIARILGMNKDHLKVEARGDALREFVAIVRAGKSNARAQGRKGAKK